MQLKPAILFFASLLLFVTLSNGEEWSVRAPDESLEFRLRHDDEELSFRIIAGKETLLQDSLLSLTIDGVKYPGSQSLVEWECTYREETIVPVVPTVHSKANLSYAEAVARFEGSVSLRIRVYTDGFAYRWESCHAGKTVIIIDAETLSLDFAKDFPVYYPIPNGEGFFSSQENLYQKVHLSEITDLNVEMACAPLLVELNEARYMLLTDVNVSSYPGLWLQPGQGSDLEAVFPPYPAKEYLEKDRYLKVAERENYLARTEGPRIFPWRAFLVTDDSGLLTSMMLYSLAEPSRVKDTSWIKPGKVAWDWWNAWRLTDVDFEPGVNQQTYKHYIDFAAETGLEYVMLDEGWSEKGPENLLHVVPDLDIEALVHYADSRNVGVILWMTSTALERHFESAFSQFSDWGIRGIKVDFLQRDDQRMMEFSERVAAKAAEHRLIVDFHGGSKPTGLHRTFPNVLTHESVPGLEQNKWGDKATPEMALLIPFIRMAVGPMDYTPGAMKNLRQTEFTSNWEEPGSQGTRCHQLAMFVAYLSPLQMLADSPTKYRQNPGVLPLLADVPVTWDETIVLCAEVGDVLALARKKGEDWYICAMTDWTPRELELPLTFLETTEYELNFWKDTQQAESAATDYETGMLKVNGSSVLNVSLAAGGGYVAVLKPKQ